MLNAIKIIYESDYLTTKQKINLIMNIREDKVKAGLQISKNVIKGAKIAAGVGGGLVAARLLASQKSKIQRQLNICMQNCRYQFQTTQNKQSFDACMEKCQERENMLSQQLKSKMGINPGASQA